ncbi:MAG: cupin domain-containing protein [Candidatus Dormibacter sp.]
MDSLEGMRERREHRRRELAGPALRFDLGARLGELRRQRSYESGHSAATLVKESDFRIVLIALKAGGRINEHHANARISVHTLEGRLRIHLAEGNVELGPGELLALEPNIPHAVEGLQDSALLLTMAWTGEPRQVDVNPPVG